MIETLDERREMPIVAPIQTMPIAVADAAVAEADAPRSRFIEIARCLVLLEMLRWIGRAEFFYYVVSLVSHCEPPRHGLGIIGSVSDPSMTEA